MTGIMINGRNLPVDDRARRPYQTVRTPAEHAGMGMRLRLNGALETPRYYSAIVGHA